MKNVFSAIFQDLEILTVQELKNSEIELFKNDGKCKIVIKEIKKNWSEKRVLSTLLGAFQEDYILCSSEEELKLLIKGYQCTNKEAKTNELYFLVQAIKPYTIDQTEPYFLANFKTPNLEIENFEKKEIEFINKIKASRIDENVDSELLEFLNDFQKLVSAEYMAKSNQNKKTMQDIKWLIGNGIFMPDQVYKYDEKKNILEIIVYSNIAALSWLLTPSKLKKYEQITSEHIQVLIKYMNLMMKTIDQIQLEEIRTGDVEEFIFRRKGFFVLDELSEEEIDHYCEGVDYEIWVVEANESGIKPSTAVKASDGYGNGGAYDIRDIKYALSKFLNIEAVKFILYFRD